MANLSALEMREIVTAAYPGPMWERRCRKMSDAKIFRIYQRLEPGLLKKTPKAYNKKEN